MHCAHCYNGEDTQARPELTTDQALAVIDRMAEMGVGFVAFSGGEPVMRPDLDALMQYCVHRGIRIGLRSHATLITPDMAQRLRELGVEVVGVSLEGATADTHDAIRGRGAFDAMLQGVQALVVADVRVNTEVVLRRGNAHQAADCVRLGERLGVQEVNFAALAPQGRAQQLGHELLDHETWQQLCVHLHAESQAAAVDVSPSCAMVGACVACVEPNITPDGWVTPCYLSDRRLFYLLDTPSDVAVAVLQQTRAHSVNACGRLHWMAGEGAMDAPLLGLSAPREALNRA
jgi:MoaA/NifB/PqqE/SkfB family radical SAM enzyme